MSPRFSRKIPTTLATPGRIRLVFYTPADYGKSGNNKRYPVIINFHGGGFTIVQRMMHGRQHRLFSIQMRLSVVSTTDLHQNTLSPPVLKTEKIGVSGFSAGGNIAFSATMRLQGALLRRRGARAPTGDAVAADEDEHRIVKIIVAWYPTTDYTNTREARSLTNPRQDMELSLSIYKMLDTSYLYPLAAIKLDSPFLSPGVASAELIRLLPDDIAIFTAGWDGLMAEGERFRKRLTSLGKNVNGRIVKEMRHG
ncbi:hypothetical protein FRB96_006433 [Tulasnella sp. 330]|nr:hypothetical protein FRB96_006433 [Tulasnella sp. 330]